MNAHHWLYWIAAFIVALAILMVAAAVQEALAWRKENRKPGPCEHCGSPDRSKQCRYSWYLPYREDWKKSGADAPCYCDDYAESEMRADSALSRKILFYMILFAVVFSGCVWLTRANARDLGQWGDVDPALSEWYRSLKQPDNPTIPCCGKADSYFCDEAFEKGHAVCVIADERDDKKLQRPHVENGTRIEIPDHKLKWDEGNPEGRGIVFLSSAGFVWCYIRPGGV